MNFFLLIENENPFVLYRLPNDKKGYFLQSDRVDSVKNIEAFSNERYGFVFAPFSPEEASDTLFYKGKAEEFILSDEGKRTSVHYTVEKEVNSQYINKFNLFHQRVCFGGLKKVVLARSKQFNLERINPTVLFNLLVSTYPDAFVYTLLTPKGELWFGATPELLLHKIGDNFETMALAGTMKASELNGENLSWSEKNRHEQAIVVNYMKQSLSYLGIDVGCQPLKVKKAGPIVHLLTPLSFNTERSLIEIIKLLHPTPAVCGFPKKEALDFIKTHEFLERKYYSGFMGPMTPFSADIFVNLRSGYYKQGVLTLYAGGGIMPDSVLEQEWEETELKIQTMQQIVTQL